MQIHRVAGSDDVSFVKKKKKQGNSARWSITLVVRESQWEITQSNTVQENLHSQQLWVKLSHQTFIYPLLLCSLSSITTNTLAADYKGQQISFSELRDCLNNMRICSM